MKKRIFVLSVAVAATFLSMTNRATAQNSKERIIVPEAVAREYTRSLSRPLGLSSNQSEKVYDLYYSLAKDNLPAFKEKMEQMKEERKDVKRQQKCDSTQQRVRQQRPQGQKRGQQAGQGRATQQKSMQRPMQGKNRKPMRGEANRGVMSNRLSVMLFNQNEQSTAKIAKEMKSILSTEQFAKWEEITTRQKEHKARQGVNTKGQQRANNMRAPRGNGRK